MNTETRTPRLLILLAAAVVVLACGAAPADAYVYWAKRDSHEIARIGNHGDTLVPALATGLTGNQPQIAADGEHLYWTDLPGNRVGRSNLDGTDADPDFITGGAYPADIEVTDEYIYFTNILTHSIGRAKLDGTDVDHTFMTGLQNLNGVTVRGGYIYWSDFVDGRIGRARLDGTGADPDFIATGGGYIHTLTTDANYIYWTDWKSHTIGRVKLDGSGVQRDFVTGLGAPVGVAVTSRHVYWSDVTESAIGRANLDGTGVDRKFVADAGAPIGLWANEPTASASASTIDFGGVGVETLAAARPFVLTNNGPDALQVERASISGSDVDDFLISSDGCSGRMIEPGSSCTVGVRFGPGALGARSARLSVVSDALDGSFDAELTGFGTAPAAPAGAAVVLPSGPAPGGPGGGGTGGPATPTAASAKCTVKRAKARRDVVCKVRLGSSASRGDLRWRLQRGKRVTKRGTVGVRRGAATIRIARLARGRYVLDIDGKRAATVVVR